MRGIFALYYIIIISYLHRIHVFPIGWGKQYVRVNGSVKCHHKTVFKCLRRCDGGLSDILSTSLILRMQTKPDKTHKHSEGPKQALQFWKKNTYKGIFWKAFEGEMLI